MTIPSVTGVHCPGCSEVVLERVQCDRYGDLIGVFQSQVSADLAESN